SPGRPVESFAETGPPAVLLNPKTVPRPFETYPVTTTDSSWKSPRNPTVPPKVLRLVPPVSGAFDVVCHRPPTQPEYLFLPDLWLQVSSASTRGILVKR